MLTKHIFNEDGSFYAKASIGSIVAPEGCTTIENFIQEYPYPVKLENGVICQDADYQPIDGKWVKVESKSESDSEKITRMLERIESLEKQLENNNNIGE